MIQIEKKTLVLRVCPREDQVDGGTVEITDFAHISPTVALW